MPGQPSRVPCCPRRRACPGVSPRRGQRRTGAPGYWCNPTGLRPGWHDHLLRPAAPCSGGDRRGGCAGGLTFAVTVCGRALTVALPAVELALEPGGQGALGGQVILQAQDVI